VVLTSYVCGLICERAVKRVDRSLGGMAGVEPRCATSEKLEPHWTNRVRWRTARGDYRLQYCTGDDDAPGWAVGDGWHTRTPGQSRAPSRPETL